MHDGKVSDLIPEVAERYLKKNSNRCKFEIWKPLRQVRSVKQGFILRIQSPE